MPTHDIFKPAESKSMPVDIVNHPDHYCQNGMEAIDVMKSFSDKEEFAGHLRLTCIKYLLRMNTKDTPEVNVRKAKWYLDRLVREISE